MCEIRVCLQPWCSVSVLYMSSLKYIMSIVNVYVYVVLCDVCLYIFVH